MIRESVLAEEDTEVNRVCSDVVSRRKMLKLSGPCFLIIIIIVIIVIIIGNYRRQSEMVHKMEHRKRRRDG